SETRVLVELVDAIPTAIARTGRNHLDDNIGWYADQASRRRAMTWKVHEDIWFTSLGAVDDKLYTRRAYHPSLRSNPCSKYGTEPYHHDFMDTVRHLLLHELAGHELT